MTTSRFFILSLVLALEISIGYGMAFVLQGNAESASQTPPALYVAQEREKSVESEEEAVLAVDPVPATPPSSIVLRNSELTPQGQLANPPEVIKAVYLTSWSGGSKKMIDYVIQLAKTTELNAVVIDVKDFSGEVAYETSVPEVKQYGAERIKIWNIAALLERLHEEGLYVIARVTVFQDPVLVGARPDLAVQSIENEEAWTDYKGLGWIDPASQEAWNYTVAIARDAASKGFDEINFDYVRFPSDGNLKDMKFPFWDELVPQHVIMREFFSYMREHLSDVVISADLFGLSTSSRDDLGIGQIIEDAYEYFDYVYPMVYPSHYARGYLGHSKPAEYPYEVVHYSMTAAQARLDALRLANPEKEFAKLRPWLQDFDLGADYTPLMVKAQVQAAKDALGEEFSGFLLWAPTNRYDAEALNPFVFDPLVYNSRPRTIVPAP